MRLGTLRLPVRCGRGNLSEDKDNKSIVRSDKRKRGCRADETNILQG